MSDKALRSGVICQTMQSWVQQSPDQNRRKSMKRKNIKVGLRVELKVALEEYGLNAGDIGVVHELESVDYKGEVVCSALFGERHSPWWLKASQIRIADKVRKVKPSEPAPSTKMTWPWPAGTLVRLKETAYVQGYREVCVLGSDGTDLPPVMTKGGNLLCFASKNSVTLAEDPEVAA